VNADYSRKALEKVGNPNVLINLISKRVRQLSSGGGGTAHPLIMETAGVGSGDIALLEIIDGKMAWELPEDSLALEPASRRRRRI